MEHKEDIGEIIFWRVMGTIFIIGVMALSCYVSYKSGKYKYFDARYKQGFQEGDSYRKALIEKEKEQGQIKKQQITQDTELILYLKSKDFPEVNIVKYTLYNDKLKLSATIDFDRRNGRISLGDFIGSIPYVLHEDKVIDMLKNEIASQLKEKFIVKEVDK